MGPRCCLSATPTNLPCGAWSWDSMGWVWPSYGRVHSVRIFHPGPGVARRFLPCVAPAITLGFLVGFLLPTVGVRWHSLVPMGPLRDLPSDVDRSKTTPLYRQAWWWWGWGSHQRVPWSRGVSTPDPILSKTPIHTSVSGICAAARPHVRERRALRVPLPHPRPAAPAPEYLLVMRAGGKGPASAAYAAVVSCFFTRC